MKRHHPNVSSHAAPGPILEWTFVPFCPQHVVSQQNWTDEETQKVAITVCGNNLVPSLYGRLTMLDNVPVLYMIAEPQIEGKICQGNQQTAINQANNIYLAIVNTCSGSANNFHHQPES